MGLKKSFGVCHFNNGIESVINEQKYEVEVERRYYLFDVVPMGAVRMTQSDRWKTNPRHVDPNKRQREVVTQYFEFKNKVLEQAREMKFELPEVLEIVFCVPMPFTWSEKKKVRNNKLPVKKRPDIDNYVKAFMDAMSNEDGNVWKIISEKRYAYRGSILVYA